MDLFNRFKIDMNCTLKPFQLLDFNDMLEIGVEEKIRIAKSQENMLLQDMINDQKLLEKVVYCEGTWMIPFGGRIYKDCSTAYQYCICGKGDSVDLKSARINQIEYIRSSPKHNRDEIIARRYVEDVRNMYEFLKEARNALIEYMVNGKADTI